jgi:hypothetical protein
MLASIYTCLHGVISHKTEKFKEELGRMVAE